MSWDEGFDLAQALMADPTSHLRAAKLGWAYPWSHEARALADLYDLTLAANSDRKKRRKAKPYPRPFETNTRSRSRKPTVDQATIRAALAARAPRRAEDGR